MKKLTFVFAAILLSIAAAFSQADKQAARIRSAKTQQFEVRVYIPGASVSNPKNYYIDWGDGNGKVLYTSTSSTYQTKIKQVNAGVDIQIYSSDIKELAIKSDFKELRIWENIIGLTADGNCNKMGRANLDYFYQGLAETAGLMKIGSVSSSSVHYQAELVHSNMFEAIRKGWRILDTTTNVEFTATWAKENLIPAITYISAFKGGSETLRLNTWNTPPGGGYRFNNGYVVSILDGPELTHYTVPLSNDATALANYTITKTRMNYEVKVYGGAISHFHLDDLRRLNVKNAVALRNLRTQYSDSEAYTYILDLRECKELVQAHLLGNANISGVYTSNLTNLKYLALNSNERLTTIWTANTPALETINFSRCPLSPVPSSLSSSKLRAVYAENNNYDACEMNDVFTSLSSNPPSGAFIYVNDENFTTPKNDFEGADKTIARNKGWQVRDYNNGAIELKGNGYGCGYATPFAGSPVVTMKVSGAKISMNLWGDIINPDDSATPVWIESSTGQYTKKLIKKNDWTDSFDVPVNSSTMRIHGHVKSLALMNQSISQISISDNHPNLSFLWLYGTNMGPCALDELYYDLPKRNTDVDARIFVKDGTTTIPGYSTSNTSIANKKNWRTVDTINDTMTGDGTGCLSGIDDIQASDVVKLYPSPATDRITVELPQGSDVKEITILDLSGREMIRTTTTDSKTTIDINELSSGIYLIKAGTIIRRLVVE